jgi:hypothetical protein
VLPAAALVRDAVAHGIGPTVAAFVACRGVIATRSGALQARGPAAALDRSKKLRSPPRNP